MKLLIVTTFFACLSYHVFSQATSLLYQDTLLYIDKVNISNTIGGNATYGLYNHNSLLSPDWGTGTVLLKNGEQLIDTPLNFDVETNRLYYKKSKAFHKFHKRVIAFKMNYFNDLGNGREVYFRSGYPNHKGKPTSFLYLVINNGPNVQLIKRLQSYNQQKYVPGGSPTTNYTTFEEFYIYNVKKNLLFKIAMNKKSVEKALPGFTEKVETFAIDHHCSFTYNRDINELISFLNGN